MGRLRPQSSLTELKAARGQADSCELARAKLRVRIEIAEIRRKLRAAGEAGLWIFALGVLFGIFANIIVDRCSRASDAEANAQESRNKTQAWELKR